MGWEVMCTARCLCVTACPTHMQTGGLQRDKKVFGLSKQPSGDRLETPPVGRRMSREGSMKGQHSRRQSADQALAGAGAQEGGADKGACWLCRHAASVR